jgi:hypothetical protein
MPAGHCVPLTYLYVAPHGQSPAYTYLKQPWQPLRVLALSQSLLCLLLQPIYTYLKQHFQPLKIFNQKIRPRKKPFLAGETGLSSDTRYGKCLLGVATPPPQGKAVRAMRPKYPACGWELSQPATHRCTNRPLVYWILLLTWIVNLAQTIYTPDYTRLSLTWLLDSTVTDYVALCRRSARTRSWNSR